MSGTTAPATPNTALADAILRALDSCQTGVTVVTVDEQGRAVRRYANRAFADLLELDLSDARTVPPMGFVAPEERERLQPLYDSRMAGEALANVQTIFVTASGRRIPVELALARTTLAGAAAGVVFVRDISDRVEIEQALRSSEARFRRLAEGAPDGITVHVRGRLVYANQFVIRMTGARSFEDLAARGILSVLPEEQGNEMVDRLARVAAGESMGPREYDFRGENTSGRIEVRSISFEHDGQPAVLSFSRDVSDRQRMVEDLRRADRLAALGTLAAAVAHEVNNPLTYVLLHLGELRTMIPRLSSGPEATEAGHMIAEALEGAERVRVLVRDLLSFARSDPGSRESVPIERAIESAIKLAGNVLRHRVRLIRDYAPTRPVAAAAARLEQVFVNLLVNAAQAIPEDATDPGEIRITVQLGADDRVVVEIADNGPGISALDLPHVFEPFFTTKPEGIGTGLGLAICRTIVESLSGTISVHCPAAGGTVVRVSLPVTDAPVVPAPAPVPEIVEQRSTPRRARLLVVDDEVRLTRLLATLVGDAHTVDIATCGEEALERIQSGGEFDVVLCDLMMPDMTGMDLYETVCRLRPEMATRFVFLTGGAFTERAARFIARPNVTTIFKPFGLDEIEAAIQTRLSDEP